MYKQRARSSSPIRCIYIIYSIFYVPGPNIIYSETESAHDVES